MIFLATLTGDQVWLLLAGIFGMLLLSIALVVFFIAYQRRLFAQEQLRRAEEQAHQQELLTASVAVQEAERRRIATDLHDDIGSLLGATRLYLRQLDGGPEGSKNAKVKSETLSLVDSMFTNVRTITHDLLPPELERYGFFAAAEELATRITGSGGALMTVRTERPVRLPKVTELALYRILQELVSNTIKHSGAAKITLTSKWSGEDLQLRYADDGRGFTPARGGKSGDGLGLLNLESRISLVGGSIAIESTPGQGMTATFTVPAPQPPGPQRGKNQSINN